MRTTYRKMLEKQSSRDHFVFQHVLNKDLPFCHLVLFGLFVLFADRLAEQLFGFAEAMGAIPESLPKRRPIKPTIRAIIDGKINMPMT